MTKTNPEQAQDDQYAWLLSRTQQREVNGYRDRLSEERARAELAERDRDLAIIARINLEDSLCVQAFIGHDAVLTKEVDVTEDWLNGQEFLTYSAHLDNLIKRANRHDMKRLSVQDRRESFIPWRPNVMQPVYTANRWILFDDHQWRSLRSKPGQDGDDFFVSINTYGKKLSHWLGKDVYETLVKRFLDNERILGEKKNVGQQAQDYRRKTFINSAKMSVLAIWSGMEISESQDTAELMEVGRILLADTLESESIISVAEYKFVYDVGNLIKVFLGNGPLEVGREISKERMNELVTACLN